MAATFLPNPTLTSILRPLFANNRSRKPSLSSVLRTKSKTHGIDSPYSNTAFSPSHRGLALPYPVDTPANIDVFEEGSESSTTNGQESDALSDMVLSGDFSSAAKLRISLVQRRTSIAQHWAYEAMAMRMLSRSENQYGKVRVNSFLIWWSMIPDHQFYTNRRPQNLQQIFHILSRLSDPECPNDALIRFGLLAAAKGYGNQVFRLIIPYIVLWAPPTISNKFLADFARLALSPLLDSRPRVRSQIKSYWYWTAIRIQLDAGRFKEAASLYSARPPCEWEVKIQHYVERRFREEGLDHLLNNTIPTSGQPISPQDSGYTARSSQIRFGIKKPKIMDIFVRPHPFNALKLLRSHPQVVKRALPPEYLASLMFYYLEERKTSPGLNLLSNRFLQPAIASIEGTYDRVAYWGMAATIYHLRYRSHPGNAFRAFCMHFDPSNCLPRSLLDALQRLPNGQEDTHGDAGASWLHGPTLTRRQPVRPPPAAISLLWQIVLGGREQLGLDWEATYDAFLEHSRSPLRFIDDEHDHSIGDLRRIHSKMPSSPNRANVYVASLPPSYRQRADQFNAFLWGCTGKMDTHRNKGHATVSLAVRRTERVVRDMVKAGVTPTLYTYERVAVASAYAGDWPRVRQVLRQMRSAGLWHSGDDTTRTKTYFRILKGLKFSGCISGARQLRHWLQSGRMGVPILEARESQDVGLTPRRPVTGQEEAGPGQECMESQNIITPSEVVGAFDFGGSTNVPWRAQPT